MIFIESNEVNHITIPSAIQCGDLESLTGADFAISPLTMPFNEKLLPRHIEAGMLLVQRKSGQDFPASIADGRLYSSLAKMRETGARQWQCILLTTSHFYPHKSGTITIDTPMFDADGHIEHATRHYPHLHYTAIQSAITGWTWYGGVYVPLTCDDEIPSWCTRMESRLIDKQQRGIKELWPTSPEMHDPPEQDDPLQEPVLVKDWRGILAAFPGVGPTRVNALRDAMIEHKASDTLFQALWWATGTNVPKVAGWVKGTKKRVREALGIPDGFELALEYGHPLYMLEHMPEMKG